MPLIRPSALSFLRQMIFSAAPVGKYVPPRPAAARIALRYVAGDGQAAASYPANPNGSEGAVAGLCNDDGRVTILMPHPERTPRSANLSWAPRDWPQDSPWLRMFRNARAFVG